MTGYRLTSVPVRGGELTVGQWGPDDGIPVLASHGITASHRCWPLVADRLPGVRAIAPDLRGRGGSRDLPGPWGMSNHADDLAAVLDANGVDSCLVVGHSMGGFVSVEFARRHPERASGLVLIDGGLPIPRPVGVSDSELAAALIGPAAARLSMTFPDVAAYLDFWRGHPAFRGSWNSTVEAYLRYDLVGTPPDLHASTRIEAVEQDSLQLEGDSEYASALAALEIPIDFLRAPRGLLDQVPPLYPDEQVAKWRELVPAMRIHELDDVNHYTVLLDGRGADAVATVVGAALTTTHPAAASRPDRTKESL